MRGVGFHFIICVGLLVGGWSSFAFAQLIDENGLSGSLGFPPPLQSSSSLLTNSPVPFGGVVNFLGTCPNVWNQLAVCRGSSGNCSPSSNQLLCASPLSMGANVSCAYSTVPMDWGVVSFSAGCCDQAGVCVSIPNTNPLLVGVNAKLITPASELSPELGRVHVARQSASRVIVAWLQSGDYWLSMSSDNGTTWSNPFRVSSIVPAGAYPLNENGFTVKQLDFAWDGSTAAMAFAVQGNASGNNSIYYAECPASIDCSLSGSWSARVTHIIAPLIATTQPPQAPPYLFSHLFSNPDLEIGDDHKRHILLHDASTAANRIKGLFHYYCTFNCTQFSSWKNPAAGADITNSQAIDVKQYDMAVRPTSAIPHVVWEDSGRWYYSFYDAATDAWALTAQNTPFQLPFIPSNVVSNPFAVVSAGDRTFLGGKESLPDGSQRLIGFLCSSQDCRSSSWSTQTSLNAFQGNSISKFGFSAASFYLAFADVLSNSVSQVWGLNPTQNPLVLASMSATATGFDAQLESVSASPVIDFTDFLVRESDGSLWLYSSSNISSFPNNGVNLSVNSIPPSPWQAPPSAVQGPPTYTRTITFSISDADAIPNGTERLYLSIGLGNSPGQLTYALVSGVDLQFAQNGSLSNVTCAGGANAGFVVARTCTATLTLISPSTALIIPDGMYYLSVRASDAHGSTATVNGGQIVLDLSSSVLNMIRPADGEVYTQSHAPNFIHINVQNAVFSNTLQLRASDNRNGNVLQIFPISSYGVLNGPDCSNDGVNLYECFFPVDNSIVLEGKYDILFQLSEDGMFNQSTSITDVTWDVIGPHFTFTAPTGAFTSSPSELQFTLEDSSGLVQLDSVQINGSIIPVVCPGSSGGSGNDLSLNCTASLSNFTSPGTYLVSVASHDWYGNSSNNFFSYDISLPNPACPNPPCDPSPAPDPGGNGSGGGGGGGSGSGGGIRIGPITIPEPVVVVDDDDGVHVIGTPIVIPRTIVESVRRFASGVRAAVNDLVEVTGPSATAIFIGICTLAGIASDSIYRRMFSQIISAEQRKKQLLIRATLAGVFALLPLSVGLGIGLAIGFIFVVLEFMGFAGAWYVVQILQKQHAFGFNPIAPVSLSNAGQTSPMSSPAPPIIPPKKN